MFIFRRRRRRRRRKTDFVHLVLLLSISLLSFNVSSLSCKDNRCKTESCNEKGTCICNQPDPSTILDGDRSFLGGRFCDEEQTMCDGTNSFWCEHGATCEEIVHGENYTCKCRPGYTGEHCEHSGAPCGKIFCFHQAECLVEGDVCECPPDWKGSVDCSLPTRTKTDSVTSSTVPKLPHAEGSHRMKGLVVILLVISCLIGAVVGAVIYMKRFLKKKETNTTKFQQLSQMQMQDFLDDEEDESFVPRPAAAHNDDAHL